MSGPIEQFEIKAIAPVFEIGGKMIELTNSSLFMLITLAVIGVFFALASASKALVPGRLQSVAELIHSFVADTVRGSMGEEGMKFFPLVFSLFIFVLTANMIGMIPGGFTVTSHVIVTFALAALVIGTVIFYGLYKHGLHFFGLFVPSGVPTLLLPFIVMIEVLSFLSRPISLALRLFANMLAGHIALKVFASFVIALGGLGFVGVLGATLPLGMIMALTALEFLVAFLQAYVFAVLTCIYLNDALHPGH